MKTIGLKIKEYEKITPCISIIRKYTRLSISDIQNKINRNEYVLICNKFRNNEIKAILKCYAELQKINIVCELYDNDRPTTVELLNNLLGMYKEIEEETEAEIDEEIQEDNH